jgi:hypothetical protein
MISRVVRRQLGSDAQREDVDDGVQYILMKLVETGVLAQYDPEFISPYNGRRVTFQAFLMNKVELYCRYLREKLAKQLRREQLLVDAGSGMESEPWLDMLASTDEEYPSLEGIGLNDLREELAARENTPGRAPVLPLFDSLSARVADGKRVSFTDIRRKFKLDEEGARLWFEELAAALRDVVTHKPLPEPAPEPLPEPEPVAAPAVPVTWFAELQLVVGGEFLFELGGMTLTAAEVRAAATALKETRGNRVMPAFTTSGHKLASAGLEWYLGFARQVMEQFPELRTAPGGHYPGGHFGRVKNALIFGLDQLTADMPEAVVDQELAELLEPAPVPSPDAQAWAEVEAALRKLPGIDPAAALAAVRATARPLEVATWPG